MMIDQWDERIRRAEELATKSPETQELLFFYAKLLVAQKEIYEFLRSRRGWLPCGDLEKDLPELRPAMPRFLKVVESQGPTPLAGDARDLLAASATDIDEMLLDHWRSPSDIQFFPKAFLQPYARWLAETGASPGDREVRQDETRCPFCGGNPQVSFLRNKEPSSESGNRDLLCATCLSVWSFRRVVCANCGEENPAKLGYFHTPKYNHVRIEACDTCKHYLKGIDLTEAGFAVPLVDEVAAAPLDLWARDHGYRKIELNLVGL
jgi:FdhE protein